MIYKVNNIIVIDLKVRGYCKFPYHGHKDGCPNFNVHNECPPKIKTVDNYFDFSKDLFFIVTEFDLKSHIEKMRQKHPEWTLLQLRNLLYWQGGVRKILREKTELFINNHIDKNKLTYTLLPEAMGIDVFSTVNKIGIPIERNPINKIFKIALVGYNKSSSKIKTLLDY